MNRTIEKKDFTLKDVLAMEPGEQVIVVCPEYNDMNRAGTLARVTFKRYENQLRSKGATGIDVHKAKDSYNMIITMK